MINVLKGYFGELTVEKGNRFSFLGMNIHVRKDKKIEIEMEKHIEEALDWFGENITEKPANPCETTSRSEERRVVSQFLL